MRFGELLRLVKNNLLRMKFRVLMTSAGVFIGTTAVILLISLGAGLQRLILQSLGDIGDLTELEVIAPGGNFFGSPVSGVGNNQEVILNNDQLDVFRQFPGVEAVTPLLGMQVGAQIKFNRLEGFSTIQGIDPVQLTKFDFKVRSGVAEIGPWQAIVGSRVTDNFFDSRTLEPPDQPLDLQGQTLQLTVSKFSDEQGLTERTVRLRVVGVLEEVGGSKDFTIYVPIRNVEDLNAWGTGQRTNYNRVGYGQALVKVASPDQATAVERMITQQGFFVFSLQSALQSINVVFLVIQAVVGAIGGLALLVAAFGIANTMVMSIYERTREIGLMKAVGATNRDVMLIFLTEAGTIGLIGGIGGVVVGFVLGQALGLVGREFLLAQIAQSGTVPEELASPVYTPLWLPLFALTFATLVGVVSGIYPALRAVRLDPIAALRYE